MTATVFCNKDFQTLCGHAPAALTLPHGSPISPDRVNTMLKHVLEKAGIPNTHTHVITWAQKECARTKGNLLSR